MLSYRIALFILKWGLQFNIHIVEELPRPIRLAGSYQTYMGRVRINVGGLRWGSICGEGWDVNDANVVCRQMGFQVGHVIASSEMEFGQPFGPVVMSHVSN